MQLSVVIVNYNVKYFLKQALESVFQSNTNFDFEVFVVDNRSVDGSVEMVAQHFPTVNLIANKENVGFSKGNNIAIQKAKGKYVLLLNPDTIIKEDTFQKVVDFMNDHPKAGGLGVKMMDGNGNFLPESKRGFPTPFVAFCKMSGLSKLFPKSKKFNQYHAGFLDRNEVNEVEVLSGAFMLLRKSVIDKIGALDEDYFMYGEDIDLSYRIKKAGYQNYYFPETEIIHFKGESTKKGSFNYVKMFYKAMIIFSKKHFTGSKAKYLTTLLSIAIYLRASMSFIKRSIEKIIWPLLDSVLIFGALLSIKIIWENQVKEGIQYPTSYLYVNIPMYIGIWLFSFFLRGGYESPLKIKKIASSIGLGTLIILAVYALLPLSLRSSRAMILIGALAAIIILFSSRIIYLAISGQFKNLIRSSAKLLIIASEEESKRIMKIVEDANLKKEIVGVANDFNDKEASSYLGNLSDVQEIVQVHKVDEVIFSLKDISSHHVMKIMSSLGGKIHYKIISDGSKVIIGSNSKNTAGDLYTLDINFHLNQAEYRRNKRGFDIMSSVIFLMLIFILVWFVKNKSGFIKNCFQVIKGDKTWVGYASSDVSELPKLKKGVLAVEVSTKNEKLLKQANAAYAKSYTWTDDLLLLFKFFKQIGKQ